MHRAAISVEQANGSRITRMGGRSRLVPSRPASWTSGSIPTRKPWKPF